jgi:hypothetical protein
VFWGEYVAGVSKKRDTDGAIGFEVERGGAAGMRYGDVYCAAGVGVASEFGEKGF